MDSIEKLGDLRIARGGFKERIMGPVTTAPLAMADCCISSGCLAVCLVGCLAGWQISGKVWRVNLQPGKFRFQAELSKHSW